MTSDHAIEAGTGGWGRSPSLPHARATWAYRPQLDGLRALAVVAVMGFHFLPGVVRGGHLGVELFFVLSGYLITGLLVAEHAGTSRIDLGAFWARRALRLYPALFLIVIATLLFAGAIGNPSLGEPSVLVSAVAALLYVNDFALLAGNFDGYLDPTWSLAVEEQFYIAWPLVLRRLLRTRSPAALARIVGVLAAVCAIASSVTFFVATRYLHHRGLGFRIDYFTPLGHATALLTGCVVALAPPRPSRWLSILAAAGGAVMVALFLIGPRLHDAALWEGLQPLFVLAAGAVIAHQASHRFHPLAAAPAVWLGRRSYGVYLWHQAILVAVSNALTHPSRLEIALIGIPASITIAALSYRYVEQPFLRYKTRFARVPGAALPIHEEPAVIAGALHASA